MRLKASSEDSVESLSDSHIQTVSVQVNRGEYFEVSIPKDIVEDWGLEGGETLYFKGKEGEKTIELSPGNQLVQDALGD